MTSVRILFCLAGGLAPGVVPAQSSATDHREILRDVLKKDLRSAHARLEAALQADAKDPETWFMKTVVAATAGRIDESLAAWRRALDLGLPPGRFVAGPRRLLAPIAERPEFQRQLRAPANRLVHGPMLGQLTSTGVKVWVRTAAAVPVVITMTPTEGDASSPVEASGATSAAADFTASLEVKGLRPGTEYRYTVGVAGAAPIDGGRFTTLNGKDQFSSLRIAFGGGAGYAPEDERIWTTIASRKPHLLFLLGDNVAHGAPQLPALQRYCYYRRHSRPEFRRLVRSTSVSTIWNERDFAPGQHGAVVDQPAWKRQVFEVFAQNWVNPGYGGTSFPGCFYEYPADHHTFCVMLDGRYYRNDPAGESPSMLGRVQKGWLRGVLTTRRELFKVICSPVPWSTGADAGRGGTWSEYQADRAAFLDILSEMRAEGVILLSGGRQRSDIWKLQRKDAKSGEPTGYPLIEVSSARLTGERRDPPVAAAEFSYAEKPSFGLLEFDLTAESPLAIIKIVDIDGKVVHVRKIPYSELCYPH